MTNMDGFAQINVRLPDLIPPRGAKAVGVFDDGVTPGGKIIYEMDVLDINAMIAGRAPLLDANGEFVYRRNAAGVPVNQRFVLPKPMFRRKRFILVAHAVQKVTMVEHFEESAADKRDREEKQMVAGFAQDMALEAVRRGFGSAREMIDALLGKADERSPELAQMTEDADTLLEEGTALGGEEIEAEPVAVAAKGTAGRKSKS